MTSMTMAQWAALVQQQAATYQSNNQYVVAGRTDLALLYVSQSVQNDLTAAALKLSRSSEATAVRSIAMSSADSSTKQKQTAQAKLLFLQQSMRALQAGAQTGDPQTMMRAVHELSTQLSAAVTAYKTGMANVQDTAADNQFIATAGSIASQMKSLIATENPRLIQANIFYSADAFKSLKTINAIQVALAAPVFKPAAPVAPQASPTSPSSGTDITI